MALTQGYVVTRFFSECFTKYVLYLRGALHIIIIILGDFALEKQRKTKIYWIARVKKICTQPASHAGTISWLSSLGFHLSRIMMRKMFLFTPK